MDSEFLHYYISCSVIVGRSPSHQLLGSRKCCKTPRSADRPSILLPPIGITHHRSAKSRESDLKVSPVRVSSKININRTPLRAVLNHVTENVELTWKGNKSGGGSGTGSG